MQDVSVCFQFVIGCLGMFQVVLAKNNFRSPRVGSRRFTFVCNLRCFSLYGLVWCFKVVFDCISYLEFVLGWFQLSLMVFMWFCVVFFASFFNFKKFKLC